MVLACFRTAGARVGAAPPGPRRIPSACLLLVLAAGLLPACAPSIHDRAAAGDIAALLRITEAQPERVNERNRQGKTPIYYAITGGHTRAVELLIDRGADVNVSDVTGLTPLHVAAMLGRLPEAHLLLACEAELEARDDFGGTPLHTAAIWNKPAVADLLIRQGAELNVQNDEGCTPLDWAIRRDSAEVAELLRARGGETSEPSEG